MLIHLTFDVANKSGERFFFLNHIVLSWIVLSKRNGNKFKVNTVHGTLRFGAEQWRSSWGTGLLKQRFQVQYHKVAEKTASFHPSKVNLMSIKDT